ncbi:MAG: hydroxyethylthiazole kinase [Bacillota bacterium]
MELTKKCTDIFQLLRARRPLIHHMTNLVVTNVAANATLALGASPVMAYAREEVAEMARVAGALVLNIGTLDLPQVENMILAGRAANEAGVPVILDPVGAGATTLRTDSASRIMREVKISIVRGNASEISIIGGYGGRVKGVDAEAAPEDMARVARELAGRLQATVAITGAVDYISDGSRVLAVENGHPLLTLVTGTGCMATGTVAAFAAVESDHLLASAAALGCYGLAAEQAAASAGGPGTFQALLFDSIYNMTLEILEQGLRIKQVQ